MSSPRSRKEKNNTYQNLLASFGIQANVKANVIAPDVKIDKSAIVANNSVSIGSTFVGRNQVSEKELQDIVEVCASTRFGL